jgi:hypothetical protein
MILLITELLGLALACLTVCYLLGQCLLRWTSVSQQDFFFDSFLSLLTGLTVLTITYALGRTGGVTIMSPVLLILGGILYLQRFEKPVVSISPRPVMAWGVIMIVGSVMFVVQCWLVYEPGSSFLQTPFQDYVYYSRLTLPLNELGIETNSLEVVFPQFQTEQPYHYFEIWWNALLIRVTGLPSVWVFFLSASSVLITICGIGFAAIYTHCGVRAYQAAILGVVSLSIVGTVWPILTPYSFFANGSLLSHLILFINPKLAPVYLFVLLAVLLLLRQQIYAAAMALAVLPLVFVATAPAIGIGLLGLVGYQWLSRRWSLRKALLLLMPIVGAVFYLGAFYTLQPEPYQFPATGRSLALSTIIPAPSELRIMLNISIGVLLNYGVYYLGYALLVIFLLLKGRRWQRVQTTDYPLLVLFVATLMGGVLMRTFAHHFLDGFQFFSNLIIPFTAVLTAFLLGRALQGTTVLWKIATATVLIGLLAVNARPNIADNASFSPQFLKQAKKALQQLPSRGGYLMADEDYKNAYMMSADSYTAGTYVSNFKNNYSLLSLSALVPDSLTTDPRFARDSVQAEQIRRKTTLYRLAKFRSLERRRVSADSLPLALVRQANLSFICASRRAVLPASLRPLVQASYRDSRSGEVLYVLNQITR